MSSISEFISAIHESHLDNGRMVYYAAKASNLARRSEIKPVMPATPFVFEYFLYNSIYQQDWICSDAHGHLVAHGEPNKTNRKRGDEREQQRRLLDEYLLPACKENPQLLIRAFAPFQYLIDLNGEWTKIIPDDKLTEQQGKDFFAAVRTIKSMIKFKLSTVSIDDFFTQLNTCLYFVVQVRNNIFHGRKKLDDIWKENQRKRIELYHLVIQSINSLFFLTRGMSEAASDEVCHPIEIPSVPKPIRLSSMEVLELRVEGMMKPEDSELIPWANECLKPLRDAGEPSGAMFYPSAGSDIIAPVLIGLPFCSEFLFYDDGSPSGWKKVIEHLGKILGVAMDQKKSKDPKHRCDIEFEYAGTKRRIIHSRAENEQFLTSNTRLIFFFHRGDSQGEGGADQPWDGEWFARWKEMMPTGRLCAVLTDGTPYGLNPELARHLTKHESLVSTPHRQPYHCGIIRP